MSQMCDAYFRKYTTQPIFSSLRTTPGAAGIMIHHVCEDGCNTFPSSGAMKVLRLAGCNNIHSHRGFDFDFDSGLTPGRFWDLLF